MSIPEIVESLEFGPAPESAKEADRWLVEHNRSFGHFIGDVFTDPAATFATHNPATGAKLATISQATAADVDAAVSAATEAQPNWEKLGGHGRAKHLYALARQIQKNARLLAVLETLDNGKPIRESRDLDVPLVARHFYYHAGAAQLMSQTMPNHRAIGVAGQIIPWNFPLLMLAWKIAPALAMGNTVVLKPAEYTPLTALLFAEICHDAGLPEGVVNIVTGDGAVGEMIVNHPQIDKIAFTGSTVVGQNIRRATAGSGKSLTLELGGKSPYVVFDDADIDSAVEGLVDAIWFNQGQVCCAGSRLLVQENISQVFFQKLRARMDKLRVGDPMDKAIDVGAIVDPKQLDRITSLVSDGIASGATVYTAKSPMPQIGCFYPPALITGIGPADRLMQEEIFGPVLVAMTFRTPSEAVELANNTKYGLAATIWSENINLALDVAPRIDAGVVWINGTNQFDASAGFGGRKASGFGREGGREGLADYVKLKRTKTQKPVVQQAAFMAANGSSSTDSSIDRSPKMWIGGKQCRPDSGYSTDIFAPKGQRLGQVGTGNRKDVRNAVEAAQKARGWGTSSGHQRAQILYFIAENLSARADEFSKRISSMTGASPKAASREVDASIQRLFSYAAWADKFDGAVHDVPIRGLALAVNEPVGVIGMVCPDQCPLLGLISLIGPTMAMANCSVVVPSQHFPLSATDFYQVLDTSDVPPGVVNIVTGPHAALSQTLALHDGVDAMWYFGSEALSAEVEIASAGNLKRTWVNNGFDRDWIDCADGEGQEFLTQSTDVKNIWIPYGE